MGDALFVHGGVTSAQEARLALAGLLALQGPTALDVRTGVLAGPGSTALVTGTSATAPMQVAIGVHDGVLSRGTANGPYVMPTEAVQLVDVGAAPGSGTRIDVVWERQKDATAGVPTPDGSYGPEYGVLAGTVGAGKPDLATLGPAGALELATVAVSASATATNGPNVVISNTARQTTTRGAPIPVRTKAERDALTPSAGDMVKRLDLGGNHERWNGSRWAPVSTADVTLGDAYLAAQVLAAATPAWTDIASVTATSTGGLCVARWTGVGFNGASGADRTMDWQVLCDSTVIGSFSGVSIPLAGAPRVSRVAAFSSTPAAAAHTWKLQARASVASSVFVETALLTVVER